MHKCSVLFLVISVLGKYKYQYKMVSESVMLRHTQRLVEFWWCSLQLARCCYVFVIRRQWLVMWTAMHSEGAVSRTAIAMGLTRGEMSMEMAMVTGISTAAGTCSWWTKIRWTTNWTRKMHDQSDLDPVCQPGVSSPSSCWSYCSVWVAIMVSYATRWFANRSEITISWMGHRQRRVQLHLLGPATLRNSEITAPDPQHLV